MSKTKPLTTGQQVIGRVAQVLTPSDARTLRWINQLNALKSRLEKDIDVAKKALMPKIKEELLFDGPDAKDACVLIGKTLIKINLIEQERPSYKDICEALIPKDKLEAAKDDEQYQTKIEYFTSKNLGPAQDLSNLVPPKAPPKPKKLRVFNFE